MESGGFRIIRDAIRREIMDPIFSKIVATLGPASYTEPVITSLIREGADVIRLNFSHGTWDVHEGALNTARKSAAGLEKPLAVFQDLQGPKIRIGQIDGDKMELVEGDEFVLTVRNIAGGTVNGKKTASIDHTTLAEEASKGNRILIDDGLIELRVEKIEGTEIITSVVNGGILKPRKGVNLPHIPLSISALTDKDRKDLNFAFEHDLDYVALSFVRHAKDISELLDLMKKTYGRRIPVISKIEKPEALRELDNIIDASDAVMVARGDLGVETSPQEVPIIQKNIIHKCNLAGKPVITATQMLESMVNNPRPTRAEANDVANAILDGTDAVMLSSETAAGKYPVEAVKMMRSIASEVESSFIFRKNGLHDTIAHRELVKCTREKTEEAVSFATIELAEKVNAKYIVSFTHSGGTARNISKFRPLNPVIAFSPVAATVRRLALVWGVRPIELGAVNSADELLDGAAEVLKFKGMVAARDTIVVTAGVPVGTPGSTNMIKVVTI